MTTEKELTAELAGIEKRRTIYWNKFDPYIKLRVGWRASAARHIFHILPGQRILEIGAGDGTFTKSLIAVTRNACEITALVFNKEYKESFDAGQDNPNLKVIYADSFPGTLAENKFDYVILHHMFVKELSSSLLYKIKALIKPGGGLMLFEVNPWNPYYQFRRAIRTLFPFSYRRPPEGTHLNRIQMFSLFSQAGYTQVNILPYDFLYAPVPKFLLWPAQQLSVILENFPYIRNFAGALYIWARNPAPEGQKQAVVPIAEHPVFFNNVSFVIPCRNEEMNIVPLVDGIRGFYEKYIYEIIIVDDNSTDNTFETARRLAEEDNRIKVIKRSPPGGVGRALADGLAAAGGEYILTMDSDFQHIIPEMRDLFDAAAQGADVVAGSRFSRDSVLLNYGFAKILANRAFHMLVNLLFRQKIRDISNNLKIFRKKAAKSIIVESGDFAANAEIGLKCLLLGYKFTEVPISWANRSLDMGLSGFRIIRTGPNYIKVLFKLLFRKMTGKPLQAARLKDNGTQAH